MSISCTGRIWPREICDVPQFRVPLLLVDLKASLAFSLASLGVLAFACAPRGRNSEIAERTATQNGKRAAQAPPQIESELAVQSTDTPGDVRFHFRVTNTGGGKVEMHFPSGQTHDVVVMDSTGREVWRWSQGRMFTKLIQNRILRNADTLAFGERWSDAPRGKYVAVARLASANFPVEQRTQFVVR